MTGSKHALVGLLLLLLQTPACALLNKAEPLTPRYFSPAPTTQGASATSIGTAAQQRVRLGDVQAASYLEARMAFRVDENELGYRDDRRWTEDPGDYLRREITRQLFEQRGVRQAFAGGAPTLDVELTAFEELAAGSPAVRLSVRYGLRGERESLREGTITIERPLSKASGDRSRAVAGELGAAMSVAVSRICDEVQRELHDVETREAIASQAN